MIDVRFSTWIKAKSLEDAWEQLRVKLIEVRLGDKLREVFTPAVLEDGEQDKKELAPLTLEELAEFLRTYNRESCKRDCPFLRHIKDDIYTCALVGDRGVPFAECAWIDVDEITKVVRGEKENERLD